jgi:proton glutamate symport protein
MFKRKIRRALKKTQRLITDYTSSVVVKKLFISFVLGALVGCAFWFLSKEINVNTTPFLLKYVSPFGTVLIKMLKMIIVPIVFFSLIVGTANMPIKKLGKVGIRVVGFYLFTSFLAVSIGIIIALLINPGANSQINLISMTSSDSFLTNKAMQTGKIHSITDLFLQIFDDPISSLNHGNFIPIIVFALLVGFVINIMIENNEKPEQTAILKKIILVLDTINSVTYRLVKWIMLYAPIGVFALSIVNFGVYGPRILGPYLQVVAGVIFGILVMIFIIYALLFKAFTKKSFYRFIRHIESAMITAFMTRSSAATLPVSLKVAGEKLRVKKELYNFSLPLGTTVNMDGVCIHLPMLAILGANLFGYDLSISHLLIIFITTFLVAIGAGGIPGGSLMLLLVILKTMGISNVGETIVITIALGVNPLLDMFETMNNVTGDLTCTYIVAVKEGLINPKKQSSVHNSE